MGQATKYVNETFILKTWDRAFTEKAASPVPAWRSISETNDLR